MTSRRHDTKGRAMVAVILALTALSLLAGEPPALSDGQTLYVPVYSHIYFGPKPRTFNLACTLSIRNTDLSSPIVVTSVDYFDTDGKKIKSYVEREMRLGALATKEIYIEEADTKGGSGANFVVRWRSEKPVNPPIVECVMIGVASSQGVSFTTRGQAILERKP